MKIYASFFLCFFITTNIFSQGLYKSTQIKIGTNYRLYESNHNQYEASIVIHPNNPDIMFASANTFLNSFISEGIYVTTNGGNSWQGNDTCTGQIVTLHGGDPGIVIDKDGIFILTRKGFSAGIYSHYSSDNGLTWSNQKIISNEDVAPERAGIVTDSDPSSVYFGRTYALWAKIAPPFPVTFVYTDDHAQNWSTPQQINNPPQRCAGGELAIDENGNLFACWASITEVSPFTEDYVGFAASTDGGASWAVDENVFDMNGIAGLLTLKSNLRVNGLPRIAVDTTGGLRNGWIYIVTGQKNLAPAGSDEDIILNRSTDGGQTWSPGIRVNQDPLNNGKVQLFPAIHVDKYGALNIIFYDDRNTTSDSAAVFLARSEDGGNSWTEFEISDHNFKPSPIAGVPQGKMGDNIGIVSANDKLWPVWMDNSTGIFQLWTVPIEISTVDVNESEQFPEEFFLYQNYPNPFNPSTSLQYIISNRQYVTLKVYDALGKEVATLVNEEKSAGKYEVEFNASFLVSGIYFYQLKAGDFVETRKMILLK